jgi:mannose-6-phosphate isomerase-like protein (cupin superfamily)
MKRISRSALSTGLVLLAVAIVDRGAPASAQAAHTTVIPADLKWGDGPASLPPGTKAAVLEGDPAKAGLFTLRLMLPANYKIPAHWHPADEHVTVLSGAFIMGLGDKLDEKQSKPLSAGGFAHIPPKTNHYAFTKVETVIQLHGMGPWAINYVNPADDPRKK